MLTARWRHSAGAALGVLVVSPTRLFARWLAYWPVCDELRSVSACAEHDEVAGNPAHTDTADTLRTCVSRDSPLFV